MSISYSSVLGIETVGVSWRVFSLTVGCIAFSLGYIIMAVIAYLETRWRYFLIWTTLPDVFVFFAYMTNTFCWKYIDQFCNVCMYLQRISRSLQDGYWHREDLPKAWKVVKKISKWNGKPLSNNIVPYERSL